MKKLLAIALAVLGIATAQALTYTWDQSSSVTFKEGYSYTLVLTINQADGGNTIQDLVSAGSGNPRLFQITTSNGNLLSADIVKWGAWYVDVGHQGKWGRLGAVPANDPMSPTVFEIKGIGTANNTLGSLSVDYMGNTDAAVVGGWNELGSITGITTISGSYSLEVTEVVPEPTALALLALGVAGLALKRKHA